MRCLIQDIQIHSLNQCRLEGADPIKKILRHDIIPEKVELINQKKSPIQDDYIEKYLVEKDLNLTATLDAEAAYKDADFVVIAAPINYDSKKNFFDTSAVENVIELVIEYNTDAVMVIKSTIPVGYTASIREKYHCDNIIFSPEFLRESKALYDNLYPLRIIVGTDMYNHREYEEANKVAEQLITIDSENVEARYVKALCLTRFDEDDEAKKILDNLLEENADNAARYYYALGRIQKKQGKYNKAIELYKTAILNRRRYLSPYRELAECYILMDNISDAKIAIENAKKIDESNVFVILLEARLLQKEDCADKAIELLENQSIFEKEPAQIFFRKGRVFDQLGNKEQAKECYIRALDYDSKTYDAKLCLLNHQIIDEPLTAEEEMIALKNVLRGKRKFILTNIEARYVGYQKHNEEKAIEILDNVPKNFRDKQWYAVKRQLLENSIRKHSLAKRDILANEYTKELKKLDDVVEQKYGNINLREVDLLPDM